MKEKRRRTAITFIISLLLLAFAFYSNHQEPTPAFQTSNVSQDAQTELASAALEELEVKGRAPKTGYSREQFGGGWADLGGCDVRNLILQRDLKPISVSQDGCDVVKGELRDPYTAQEISFVRGRFTSDDIQIDHVVALSDAWQKGAQQMSQADRLRFANDALNLLAVDGSANIKKGDGDSATWLPPNKSYRCQYVARQVAVKKKYNLWVTKAEKDAMKRILRACPDQRLPYQSE